MSRTHKDLDLKFVFDKVPNDLTLTQALSRVKFTHAESVVAKRYSQRGRGAGKHGGLRFRKLHGYDYLERKYVGKSYSDGGDRTREKNTWKREVYLSLSSVMCLSMHCV
jgi:hypothetical protein